MKFKTCLVLSLLLLPIAGLSQSSAINNFSKFVSKNYQLPDSLKHNCEWLYAVVKVKTNTANAITGYQLVSNSPTAKETDFSFLMGYKFLPKMTLKGRSAVFYFSVDNTEICNAKPNDFAYTPNRVLEIITEAINRVKKEDPKVIIIPEMVIKQVFDLQH